MSSVEAYNLFESVRTIMDAQIITSTTAVGINWLGYPLPDKPYSSKSTLIYPIRDLIRGIDILFAQYPNVQFDLVCHSLMGVIAVYWAYQRSLQKRAQPDQPNVLDRVRSIITVNSPLHGGEKFWRLARLKVSQLPENERFDPVTARDLRPNSEVVMSLKDSAKRPILTKLVTIATETDPLVTFTDALLEYADERLLIEGKILGSTGEDDDPHNQVLMDVRLLETLQRLLV